MQVFCLMNSAHTHTVPDRKALLHMSARKRKANSSATSLCLKGVEFESAGAVAQQYPNYKMFLFYQLGMLIFAIFMQPVILQQTRFMSGLNMCNIVLSALSWF